MTTFQTVKIEDNGNKETIIRRVSTKINDPIYSKIKFTGSENEEEFYKIQNKSYNGKPIDSFDEDGNITTTIYYKK